MADTPKTIKTYALDGVRRDFPITFDYLARDFIKVTLISTARDELVRNVDFRFTSANQITLNVAYGSPYTYIEIRRLTPTSPRLVDFKDGSVLVSTDLNLSQLQASHIAEEARDMTTLGIGLDQLLLTQAQVAKFLGAHTDVPMVRNDGTPLQMGDRYNRASDGAEFVLGPFGWTLNDSQQLASDLLNPAQGGRIMSYRVSPLAGAIRTAYDKLHERISVEDFGAVADGVTNDAPAINEAVQYLLLFGGGRLEFNGRNYAVATPILIYSKIHFLGMGREATWIHAIPGSNTDIFKTWNFDAMTGVGNLTSAPFGFSIRGFSLNGNYLNLSDSVSWRDADVILNSLGCGMKIFGSGFETDVEVYNVAENALYVEGMGSFFENKEHASRICLTGRVSGKEGVIFRGPGDIVLDYIVFGLSGHLPRTQRLTATTNLSTVFPGQPVHGLVLDNTSPFTGHAEIGFIHMYANSYGFGVKTLGVNRFNARHIVSENSLGGYHFDGPTHGVVAIAEARANGRYPDAYSGSAIVGLPDMILDNGTTFNLNINLKSARYSPSKDFSGYLIQIIGENNRVVVCYTGQYVTAGVPITGSLLSVTGDNNIVDFNGKRIKGNGVYVSSGGNNIRGVIDELYSGTAVIRDADGTVTSCFGNKIDVNALHIDPLSVGFNAIGTSASEILNLILSGTAGYTEFTGTAAAVTNRAIQWNVMATLGNGINGKTTDDINEGVVPAAAVQGTFTIPHNFLYTPHPSQVTISRRYPGTVPNQMLELGVVSTSATDVTLSYRWSAIPTSGGATASIKIR